MGSLRWLALAGLAACAVEPTETDTANPTPTDTGGNPVTGPTYDNVDSDNDGVIAGVDCNDLDPFIYPGAPEICGDGIDQDCDGDVLAHDVATWWPDGLNGRVLPFDVAAEVAAGDFEADRGEIVVCPGTTDLGAGTLTLAETITVRSLDRDAEGSSLLGHVLADARSVVTVEDVTLGGAGTYALESKGRNLVVRRVTFSGASGESVLVADVLQMTLQNLDFSSNAVTGPLFDVRANTMLLRDFILTGNTSGSASLVTSPVVSFNNLSIDGDSAGVLVTSNNLTANVVSITGQTGVGAALTTLNSNGTLTNIIFDGNAGSGLRVERTVAAAGFATPLVTVNNLTAVNHGGRGVEVIAAYPQNATIGGGSIQTNGDAALDGGGVHVAGAPALLTLSGVSVTDNLGANGGGLYLEAGKMVVSGGAVLRNTATLGGGAYVVDTTKSEGSMVLSGVDFGELKDDNLPDDVYAAATKTSYAFGVGASATCTDTICE